MKHFTIFATTVSRLAYSPTALRLMLCAFCVVCAAWAAGGAGLPMEAPMTLLRTSVSGPIAYGIMVIAIVLGGVGLAMTHERHNRFGEVASGVVMAGGLALGAGPALGVLYPAAAGALI
jgi:type IV secretory pathway VirB2 component (pilin)